MNMKDYLTQFFQAKYSSFFHACRGPVNEHLVINFLTFFLNISIKKICCGTKCGYSLEAPQWDTSNECTQHMFLWRNKKNISELYIPTKYTLNLKAPSKICSRQHLFLFFLIFQRKQVLIFHVNDQSSAKQTIHMKYQDLFYLKN